MAAVACIALLYTYAGYPMLIAILARLFPMRIHADPSYTPTVSVCMTMYNGAAFIDRKFDSLLALEWPPDKLEILVYSDGSTDDSEKRVESWAARTPDVAIRLVRAEVRAGKPTGLNRLREIASGEVLFMTDVRQPVSPDALRAMAALLADPVVGCVSGNLVLKGAAGSGTYWRYEKFIRRSEARFRSLVSVSGSIAMVRKADLGVLPSDILLDDMWIPMRLRLERRRIVFAEDAVAYDMAFEDDREFARKVRTLAGNWQLFAVMPRLLSPFHNPSWFETVSHKFMRLLCPFALIALVFAGWAVAAPMQHAEHGRLTRAFGTALLGGQGILYAGALLGPRLGRLGSLTRTFVVMNLAALVGLWRFARGAQRITW